jgi:hypothetical protein
MDDLKLAKHRLLDRHLSLVVVENSRVLFETDIEGLQGFLHAIERYHDLLSKAVIADKIMGKAAAFLCAYSNVKAAYAITISKGGLEVLSKHNIPCEFESVVPTILNSARTDRCPFEKLVEKAVSPTQAHLEIVRFCQKSR